MGFLGPILGCPNSPTHVQACGQNPLAAAAQKQTVTAADISADCAGRPAADAPMLPPTQGSLCVALEEFGYAELQTLGAVL